LMSYTIDKSADPNDPTKWVMVSKTSSLVLTQISSELSGVRSSVPTSGTVTITGLYGDLTLDANGNYSYVVKNNEATVQALRQASNTLTESFTYTVSTGGAQAVGVLTVQVQGANDRPVANNDYDYAKESLEATVANQYITTDLLGAKAVGNVLVNDTDVDAGDTKTITGSSIEGSATAATSGSATMTLSNTPSSLSSLPNNTYPAYRSDGAGGFVPVFAANGSTIATFTKSGSGSNLLFSISDATNVSVGNVLYVQRNATTYELVGTVSTVTPPTSTTVSLSNFTGTVAVGMTVNGTSLATAPTVSQVNYDAAGNVTSVVISQAVSLSSSTLTFSATASAGATMTGQYGTLLLNADGSYVYTPFANNPNLVAGQQVVEVFDYTMRDTAGLTSAAKLIITVLGSGTDDPNAVLQTGAATEAGGVSNATGGSDASGNLLTGTTTPVGTNAVSAVRTPQVQTATALTGSITFNSVTYAAKVTGLYGDLYVKIDGSYVYDINDTAAAVQALKTGQSLTDVFQYQISNGQGFDWSNLTVTLNGAYDAPVAVADNNRAVIGQYVPQGNVLPNDTDVDAADSRTVTHIAAGTTSTPATAVTASTSSTNSPASVVGTYGTLFIGADGSYR